MPGGVMVPIAEPQRRRIAERFPSLPMEELDRAGGMYRIERDWPAEMPATVRDNLQEISERAGALYVALATMKEETRHALEDVEPLWKSVETAASQLMGVARTASLGLPVNGGRPQSCARRALVRQIAQILDRAGIAPEQRPNGALCFVTAEVLAAYGERDASVRDIVRRAMAETT